MARIALSAVQADEGSLLLRHEAGNESQQSDDRNERDFVFVSTYRIFGDHTEPESVPPLGGVNLGEGITGSAILDNETKLGAPRSHSSLATDPEGRRAIEPKYIMATPLTTPEGERLGALTACIMHTDRVFTAADTGVFEEFAGLCTEIIEQRQRLSILLDALGPNSTGEGWADSSSKPDAASLQVTRTTEADHLARILNDLASVSALQPPLLEQCADFVEKVKEICTKMDDV
jgi:hypothetical protein